MWYICCRHTHDSILKRCEALQYTHGYTHEDVLLVTTDPNHGTGLWHGVFAMAFTGLQTVVCYDHAKDLPWLTQVHVFGATRVLTDLDGVTAAVSMGALRSNTDLKSMRRVRLGTLVVQYLWPALPARQVVNNTGGTIPMACPSCPSSK